MLASIKRWNYFSSSYTKERIREQFTDSEYKDKWSLYAKLGILVTDDSKKGRSPH